jgi:hypothetical protein
MPAPTSMADLSTTASANYPAGSDLPSALDDSVRALSSVVKYNVSKGSNIPSASSITIPANGSYFIITGTTTVVSFADTSCWDGREVTLEFASTVTLTNSSGLILPGAANYTTASGDVFKFTHESTGVWRCSGYALISGLSLTSLNGSTTTNATPADGDLIQLSDSAASYALKGLTWANLRAAISIRGHISGLTMSTAGSSSTMSIAAGAAADNANATIMVLSSAISKTTSAWAVGTAQGGIDSGTIANNTWYHFYEIRRPDTGVVDVIFSTSASAPTLPTNYTQYRRIGSGLTNGSAQWTPFVQDGDFFQWSSPTQDFTTPVNPGTSAVLRTLRTPLGVRVRAVMSVGQAGVTASYHYYSDPSTTDIPATQQNAHTSLPTSSTAASVQIQVMTNTSSQIRSRVSASDASTSLYITTTGWIDSRGKDA